jgi:hypothetical protein
VELERAELRALRGMEVKRCAGRWCALAQSRFPCCAA